MDHVHAVLKRDPNDVLLGEVRADRSEAFADLVSLIGLRFTSRSVSGCVCARCEDLTF